MEESNEVQELLSRSYATPDNIDEADLEAGTNEIIFICNFNHFRIGNVGIGTIRVWGRK